MKINIDRLRRPSFPRGRQRSPLEQRMRLQRGSAWQRRLEVLGRQVVPIFVTTRRRSP